MPLSSSTSSRRKQPFVFCFQYCCTENDFCCGIQTRINERREENFADHWFRSSPISNLLFRGNWELAAEQIPSALGKYQEKRKQIAVRGIPTMVEAPAIEQRKREVDLRTVEVKHEYSHESGLG